MTADFLLSPMPLNFALMEIETPLHAGKRNQFIAAQSRREKNFLAIFFQVLLHRILLVYKNEPVFIRLHCLIFFFYLVILCFT